MEGISKFLLLKEKTTFLQVIKPVDKPSGKKGNDLGRNLLFIDILIVSTAFTINLSMTSEHDIHSLIPRYLLLELLQVTF